jgi:hypothetical protein
MNYRYVPISGRLLLSQRIKKPCLTKNVFVGLLILSLFMFFHSSSIIAQTISSKRGVAGDLLNNADCIAADTLTWYYNWANTPNASVINSSQNYLEYCPMLWNGSWNPTALSNYLSAHPEVKYLLTFNEPNYSVQANMTPAQAAALWPQIETIANTYNLKIVSPAMSYCSGTCIAGYNNMHGTAWLDDFFTACPGCRVDHIAVHIYDTWYYGFSGVLNLYKKYNRPIWVTEFDYSGSTNATQQASLMVDVLDLMEKDPDVFRYAWFLVRSSPSATSTDIFSQTTGTLAGLGNVYEHMSSYDKNYFHNVNTIIEAEYYISKSVIYCGWNGSACTWPYSVLLEPTTDVNGRLDAYNFASPVANTNDTIYYNVNIPTTQNYTMDFRVNSTAASTVSVWSSPSNVLLGTTPSLNTGGSWLTKTLSGINLAAGQQKIYLTASNGTPLKLNWLRINCSSNCGTLPIELEYFNVHNSSAHTATLEWRTVSEKNNTLFTIEKSEDGTQFISIGSVQAAANGNIPNIYLYSDDNAFNATNYYRLKQTDSDGNFSFSPIRSVSQELSSITCTNQTIITTLNSSQPVYYNITTSTGQVIAQGSYQAESGTTEKSIAISDLSTGVYLIKVISGALVYSGKFFIHE